MKRQLGIVAALVGGLLLGLTYLALQGALPDAARHERTLEAVRTVILSEAALQRDMLRTRAGLLRSYDPLVRSRRARRRRRILAGSRLGCDRRAPGRRSTGGRRTSWRRSKAGGTRRGFKGQNALLQNSLAYFSHLTNELGGREGARDGTAANTGELANAMFRFVGESKPGSSSRSRHGARPARPRDPACRARAQDQRACRARAPDRRHASRRRRSRCRHACGADRRPDARHAGRLPRFLRPRRGACRPLPGAALCAASLVVVYLGYCSSGCAPTRAFCNRGSPSKARSRKSRRRSSVCRGSGSATASRRVSPGSPSSRHRPRGSRDRR